MHYEPATEMDRDEGLTWEEVEWDRQHDRFYEMKRHVAIGEIIRLQDELWKIEQALNVPMHERVRLEKGWTSGDRNMIAKLGAEVFLAHHKRGIELRQMESAYGKADDVRKEIEAKVREYEALCKEARVTPSFYYPKGYKGMNSKQLRDHLKAVEGWVEFACKRVHERGAEAERKQREAEIRAKHELEMKRINDERNARRDARKVELDEILRPYTETVTKILEHPVFRAASIKLPKLELDRFTVEFQLGTLGEEGYQLLLNKARNEIATNQRKLREPMRRAHQSAYSRGITKLCFDDYLRKEGFEHLLK